MNDTKTVFQEWFTQQPFHSKLVFSHGDRLFDCDVVEGVATYRVLPVQVSWVTWQELQTKNDRLQKRFNHLLNKNICDESDHASLRIKFMGIERIARSLRSEFDLNSDCAQVERQIELLEIALRGDHAS